MATGIYEVNELEGDLRKKAEAMRMRALGELPEEVLAAACDKYGRQLKWDEAVATLIGWLHEQRRASGEWTAEKQSKINDLRLFIQDGLKELPLDLFERGKKLLGLGPQEGPARPFTADDSFRDAMSHAAESIETANPTDRAGLYISMMDAIARKQAAEASEKAAAAAIQACDAQFPTQIPEEVS